MPIIQVLSRLDQRNRKRLGWLTLGVVIVLAYPFKTTVVPVWPLRVLDDAGAAVAGINVTEHWQHNSLESVGHEENLSTDHAGHVIFPARAIRASLFSRAFAPLAKIVREGNGTKLGRYASVVVWGSKNYDTAVAIYKSGEEPAAEIVIGRDR